MIEILKGNIQVSFLTGVIKILRVDSSVVIVEKKQKQKKINKK